MFFDKASQQAFVFPPKCGTNTTIKFLQNCGWKDLGKIHAPTEEFISKYPNLKNYRIYLWYRDPLKRFESGMLNIKQKWSMREDSKSVLDKLLLDQNINESRKTVSYEQLIDIFPIITERFGSIFYPQSKWCVPANVELLDFNNMETELRRITGNFDQPFVRYNTSTEFGRSVVTQKVIDFVRQEYVVDYALAKNRLNKNL